LNIRAKNEKKRDQGWENKARREGGKSGKTGGTLPIGLGAKKGKPKGGLLEGGNRNAWVWGKRENRMVENGCCGALHSKGRQG